MKAHNIFDAALTKKQIKFLRRETIRLSGHRSWQMVLNKSFRYIPDWSDEIGGLFPWNASDHIKMRVIEQRIIDYKNKLQQNRNKFA